MLTVIVVSFCFGVLAGIGGKLYMDKQDELEELLDE